MVQQVRPVQDIVTWGTGGYASVDESVASDADYMASDYAPVNDPGVVRLGTTLEPSANTGHSVKYRYEKQAAPGGGGTDTIDLTVELRQGYVSELSPGMLIDTQTHTDITDTVTAGTLSLSTGEADAITYVDGVASPPLYVRFVATAPDVAGSLPTVSALTPDNAVIGTTITITGTDFESGTTTVQFGTTNVAAADVTFVSSTEIEVDVPLTLTPGTTVNVKVTTPVGQSTAGIDFDVNFETFTPTLLSSAVHDENSGTYQLGSGLTYVAGRLYLAFVHITESGGATNAGTVVGTGQTWTRVTDDGAAVATTWGVACFRFVPDTNLTGATTSWTESPAIGHDGFIGHIVEVPSGWMLGGTNGSAAIGDVDELTAAGVTSITAALTPQASSMVIALAGHANAETNTPGGSYTELHDDQGTLPDRSAALIYDASTPGTSPSISWTTAANARMIAVEVLHEPTGGPTLPTVTDASPSSGVVGTEITVTGTDFETGNTSVQFGAFNVPAGDVTVASPTSLTFDIPAVPAGGSVYTVKVTTSAGQSTTSDTVTVNNPPFVPTVISSIATGTNAGSYQLGAGLTYQAGYLYLAYVFAQEAGGAVNAGGVSGTGQTWNRVMDDGAAVSGTWGMAAFRFAPVTTITGATTTWTESPAAGHDGFHGYIVEVPPGFLTGGTNGADAIGDVDENTGNVTSISAAITPQSDSIVIAMVGKANTEGITATGSYTEFAGADQTSTSPNMGSTLIYDDTTPGASPGGSWATSGNARILAVEVLAA